MKVLLKYVFQAIITHKIVFQKLPKSNSGNIQTKRTAKLTVDVNFDKIILTLLLQPQILTQVSEDTPQQLQLMT